MYQIALGIHRLQSHGIVHRDLKASNALVAQLESGWPKLFYMITDYECSVGVVGTGFFWAPEILQVLQERKIYQKPEVFSKAPDVYSYRMTRYEILTGELPFESHLTKNYDFSLNGGRLVVPDYIEDWTRKQLSSCWQPNIVARPTVREILDIPSANSTQVRYFDQTMEKAFGENLTARPASLFSAEERNAGEGFLLAKRLDWIVVAGNCRRHISPLLNESLLLSIAALDAAFAERED